MLIHCDSSKTQLHGAKTCTKSSKQIKSNRAALTITPFAQTIKSSKMVVSMLELTRKTLFAMIRINGLCQHFCESSRRALDPYHGIEEIWAHSLRRAALVHVGGDLGLKLEVPRSGW